MQTMSASDAKRRVKSSEMQDKISVSDKTRNGRSRSTEKAVPNETSIFRSIIEFDVKITSKAALCTNESAVLGFLRPMMIFLEWSCHGLPWIVGPILGILISRDGGLMEILMNLLLAMIVDLLVVFTLKVIFRRKRPAHNQGHIALTVNVDQHSFPSGHATRAVMTALLLMAKFELTGKLQAAVYIWMVAVPASRILLGRHHVLDVAAGVIVGAMEYIFVLNYLWMSQQTCMDLLQPIHEDLHL